MSQSTLGFTFSEVMAGGVAFGETDPLVGLAAARAAGTTMTMHGTIVIEDLDSFIADGKHPGSLTGTLDFPPLGLQMPSTAGVFNLFSPTSDPTTKYMVYEMDFEHEGQSYYVAGHKDVKEASMLALWHATTTLYTQLHRGSDKTGPVVGAGVLSLSLHDLIQMVPTMHAVNAASPQQAAEAVTKFGRFFLGELWDTYIVKKGE